MYNWKMWAILGALGIVFAVFIVFSVIAFNTFEPQSDLLLQNDPDTLIPSDYF